MNQNDRHWLPKTTDDDSYLDYVMARILVFVSLCGFAAIVAYGCSLFL